MLKNVRLSTSISRPSSPEYPHATNSNEAVFSNVPLSTIIRLECLGGVKIRVTPLILPAMAQLLETIEANVRPYSQ